MDRELPVSVWPEWKIIEKLGEGSFGKVYKAQRMERDKAFYSAIKIITIPSSQSELKSVQSEMGGDQTVREYFQNLVDECIQEVSTMEYFRGNSHVVAVEDYKVVEYLDTIGWDIYIRMEYLTGFLEYCAGKQLGENDVIQLGIDLCKSLEYCQKLNIIHRDIKPENIFVSRFGEFKLGDFGIARELERSMGTLSKKGTYSYMAPEMYRGEKYDNSVDIYSLGIMLYKLRNQNRLPFLSLEKQLITYRDKENALTRRMSGEQLPVPVDAGPEFAQVILKACAYKREDRYMDAAEFRQALENLKYNRRIAIQQAHQQKKTEEHPRQQEVQAEVQSEIQPKAQSKVQPKAQPEIQPRPRTVSADKKKRKKKKKSSQSIPLMIAVIFMTIMVVVLTAALFKHILEDTGTNAGISTETNTEAENSTELVPFVYESGTDESEKEGLAEDLSLIREYATTIVNELDTYQWIGTESQGKISYLDTVGEVRKVLVYPSLSRDGVYEEYYYWDEQLFFAYIWEDSSIASDLDEGEVRANYYYYKDGNLIRWIDGANVCHDYETDNEEYIELGEKYLDRSVEYTEEFVKINEE